MEIVIYLPHLKVDIQQTLKKYKTIKQWAYILHDKDDTDAHYHIYLNFSPSSCDTAMVAKWFNLGYTTDEGEERTGEQFIEKVKGRKTDMLLYLTHGNESQKNKHQYDASEVIANFDFETEIAASKIIGDFEHYSYAQMLQYANTLPIVEKTKALSQLKKLWELECLCASMNPHRDLQVVFIYGKTGTGKTTYAKKLLEGLNYDYSISSSSNDPFQEYLGQRGMILDDLRDTSFSFDDFLKITDNHTQSSVSSRFHNKIFIGKMLIITSSIPLKYWYRELLYNKRDDLAQLYRRITCYVEINQYELFVYDKGLDAVGNPIGLPLVYKNEYSTAQRGSREAFDYASAFGKIANYSPYAEEGEKKNEKNSFACKMNSFVQEKIK